jgi:hypothetical protein
MAVALNDIEYEAKWQTVFRIGNPFEPKLGRITKACDRRYYGKGMFDTSPFLRLRDTMRSIVRLTSAASAEKMGCHPTSTRIGFNRWHIPELLRIPS